MAENIKTQNPIERIKSCYGHLTKAHKKIADFVLARDDIGSFLSLTDLSEQSGVTAVTVVKFCKSIGYDTFSDFKKDLQSYMQAMILPRGVVKADLNKFSTMDKLESINAIIQSEEMLLKDTYSLISSESINNVIQLILSAKRVYLAARGISIPIAQILQTRLDFLSIESTLIKMDNINILPRKLINCGKDDVFIIFSFPNYSQSLGDLAECVKELDCKLICITDKMMAPPAAYSDVVLLCQTSSIIFYNSMTVPSSLVNVLATLLAIELKEQMSHNSDKLSEISNHFKTK